MEGLAAASSIAGVLSLAGQTIDGILKLQGFFKDVSSASRTMERFLSDINLLIKTIEDVRSLLGSTSDTMTVAGTDLKVVALEIQLQDCSKDVHGWLRIWSNYHPAFSTGSKASFKKFWVAANKSGVLGISQEIKGHRQSLIASLSVLGRTLDVANSGKLGSIQDMLDQEAEKNEAFRRSSMTQLTKIDSLEAYSAQSLKYCRSSKSSLQRIASSLSRIERCISSSQRAASFATSLAEDAGIRRRFSLSPISSCCSGSPPVISIAKYQSTGKRHKIFSLGGSSTSGDSSDNEEHPNDMRNILNSSISGKDTDSGVQSDCLETTCSKNDVNEEFDEASDSTNWNDDHVQFGRSSMTTSFELFTSPLHTDDCLSLPQDSISNEDTPPPTLEESTEARSSHPSTNEAVSKIVNAGSKAIPHVVRSYIEKIRLTETIKQEIQLLSLCVKAEGLESYINPLKLILASVEDQIRLERSKCLLSGHDLYPIDQILNSCKIHDSSTGLLLPRHDTSSRHGDILALRRKAAKLVTTNTQSPGPKWTSKLDQINRWLFDNLQNSSDNAALHRSMLPEGETLDEKSWARSVIKYWSIDEAAMGEEFLSSSSRGAVGSWGGSRGIRLEIKSTQRCGSSLPYLIKKVSVSHMIIRMNFEHAMPEKPPSTSDYRLATEKLKALQRNFKLWKITR